MLKTDAGMVYGLVQSLWRLCAGYVRYCGQVWSLSYHRNSGEIARYGLPAFVSRWATKVACICLGTMIPRRMLKAIGIPYLNLMRSGIADLLTNP